MNKLLPGKALLVCVLGLFAMFSVEEAVSSEVAVGDKCGITYCFPSFLTCAEVDAEQWCSTLAEGKLPSPAS